MTAVASLYALPEVDGRSSPKGSLALTEAEEEELQSTTDILSKPLWKEDYWIAVELFQQSWGRQPLNHQVEVMETF